MIVDVGHHFCLAVVFGVVALEDIQICHCFPSCIGFAPGDPITRRPAHRAHGQPSGQAQWPNPVLPLSAIASWVAVKLQMDCREKKEEERHTWQHILGSLLNCFGLWPDNNSNEL